MSLNSERQKSYRLRRDVRILRSIVQKPNENLNDLQVLKRVNKLVSRSEPIVLDNDNVYKRYYFVEYEDIEKKTLAFFRMKSDVLEPFIDGMATVFKYWKHDIMKKVTTENSLLSFPEEISENVTENPNKDNELALLSELKAIKTIVSRELNEGRHNLPSNVDVIAEVLKLKHWHGYSAMDETINERVANLAMFKGRLAAREALDAYCMRHSVLMSHRNEMVQYSSSLLPK